MNGHFTKGRDNETRIRFFQDEIPAESLRVKTKAAGDDPYRGRCY